MVALWWKSNSVYMFYFWPEKYNRCHTKHTMGLLDWFKHILFMTEHDKGLGRAMSRKAMNLLDWRLKERYEKKESSNETMGRNRKKSCSSNSSDKVLTVCQVPREVS